MAGPNKQFDQDEALNKAMQLFWEQGYEATSVQDLVDAMGINRASLYQTFGNKQELYLKSLDRYAVQILDQVRWRLLEPGTPLTNLRDLFVHVIEQSLEGKMRGCLINNTAVELGPHDAKLAEKIREIWLQFEALFADRLERAIKQHQLPANTDPHQLAKVLNINLQGLMVKTKANSEKSELIGAVDALFDLMQKNNG
jgi:TetR/AcrR family transcriptional repressor of nem operon